MRHYLLLDGDYIFAIGIGYGGEEISEEEYNAIVAHLETRPDAEEGHRVQLKHDLSWEQVLLKEGEVVRNQTGEISAKEALDIILGGAQA